MRMILLLSLLLCCSYALCNNELSARAEKLLKSKAPAHVHSICHQLLNNDIDISAYNRTDIAHAIRWLQEIVADAQSELSEQERTHIEHIIHRYVPTREPRESQPGFIEENVNEQGINVILNFSTAGGFAFNMGNAAGFNFATNKATSRQANTSSSYNLSTYGSRIVSNAGDNFNFATGESFITNNEYGRNINALSGGSITNICSGSISLVTGDDSTSVTTQGSHTLMDTAFNVVTGSNSQLYLKDTNKKQESINLVTGGAFAQNPPNGINMYPGNELIRAFGDLDMQNYNIRNTQISSADIDSIRSDDDINITYDTDDSNTLGTATDEGFNVQEGSNDTLAFRVDKAAVSLHGRPLNANENTLANVATIAGAQNRDVHVTSSASSGNTANIILEPNAGNGSGNLEMRNLGTGSGVPLVINNGVVQVESSSEQHKQDIRACSPDTCQAMLRLTPVSYVRQLGQKFREYGLVAEEVAEILPELVTYTADGHTPEGISYNQMIALLLHIVQEHEHKLAVYKQTIQELDNRIREIEEQCNFHRYNSENL